jgi:hypothetical protein
MLVPGVFSKRMDEGHDYSQYNSDQRSHNGYDHRVFESFQEHFVTVVPNEGLNKSLF